MKRVLIIGCNSGYGLHALLYLSKMGYFIYGTVLPGTSEEFYIFIKSFSNNIKIMELDITYTDSVDIFISNLFKKEKYIDIIVNNAGIMTIGNLEVFSSDSIKKIFDINCFGLIYITNSLLKINKKYADYYFSSSIAGRIAFKNLGPYSASKFALEGFVETYHIENKYNNFYLLELDFCEDTLLFYNSFYSTDIDLKVNYDNYEYIKDESKQVYALGLAIYRIDNHLEPKKFRYFLSGSKEKEIIEKYNSFSKKILDYFLKNKQGNK